MSELSPAAQAVVKAYGKCISEWFKSTEAEKPSSHYHSSGLAAALRAAALHLHCEEYETCGGASYALMIEQEDLLALAAELEGAGAGSVRRRGNAG